MGGKGRGGEEKEEGEERRGRRKEGRGGESWLLGDGRSWRPAATCSDQQKCTNKYMFALLICGTF